MSPTSTDRITLTGSQRRELTRMTPAGRTEQRLVTRAQIVLAAAAGESNAQIARWLRICEDTVRKWRRRWCAAPGAASLADAKRSGRPPVFSPVQVARVKAMACTPPKDCGLPLVVVVVVVVGWVAATPFTLRHPRVVQRVGFALIGAAQRLFEHLDATPGQYSEKDISPYFWHNGQYPDSPEYTALFNGHFADSRLLINGLVEHPVELTLTQLRALSHHEQITQHFCIQGWSGIAKWGGVSMQTILDLVHPAPEARWVVFYSLGDGPDAGIYYDAHPIEQMSNHLTMLAYDMNDEPLPVGHGAPLRLRNENQLGFKQVKWIKGIEFVTHFSEVGGGYGGYTQDHEFFGYRQTI